jgi:hypothetical protein
MAPDALCLNQAGRIMISRLQTPLALLPAVLALVVSAGCTGNGLSVDATDPSVRITSRHYVQGRIAGLVETAQDVDGVQLIAEESSRERIGSSSLHPGVCESERLTFVRYVGSDGERLRDDDFHSIEIIFIRTFATAPTGAEREAFVNRGTLPFGSVAGMQSGVEVRWTDRSGRLWSTALHHGSQVGSRFVVSEHRELAVAEGAGRHGRYYSRGWFTARLYDEHGNYLDIENGRFALQTVWTE